MERIILKGFDKVGIDTSVFVNIIRNDVVPKRFKEKLFSIKNLFYYAGITRDEFIGVLINKLGFEKDKSVKLWKRMNEAFDLKAILWEKKDKQEFISKVKEANNELVKKRNVPGYAQDFTIGKADIEIIACFLKEKVKFVYTSDRAFGETCKILGIEAVIIPLPKYAELNKL